MKLEQAIRDFVTAHEVDNDSPNTINNYRSLLPRFAAWLESVGVTDTDELRLSHLREWLVYLQKTPTKRGKPLSERGKPLSDSTVHQYAVYTHAFCHWLEEEEVIEKPITTRFKLPKVEKKFIPTFTFEDVEKLFQVLERRAGIEGKRVSAHQCRRYMATRQLELGRSPLDVQRQLGHTTLTMTNQYASLTTEHLRRSHERFSPLRRKIEDERGGFSSEHWGD